MMIFLHKRRFSKSVVLIVKPGTIRHLECTKANLITNIDKLLEINMWFFWMLKI